MNGPVSMNIELVWRTSFLLGFLAFSPLLMCQSQGAPESTPIQTTLQRFEVTDPPTGVHSVRFLLSLPSTGDASGSEPPRFTIECLDIKGRHEMFWSVSLGGVPDPGFVPPFQPTQSSLFPPQHPSVSLKMTFEGYLKSKPFIRSWSALPSGEFRYRNPGTQSPNMDSTRYFLTFLNSLPGLRIGHVKPAGGDRTEVFFPAQALLDEVKKTPLCSP